MTEPASSTKTPPAMTSASSWCTQIAITAKAPPSASDPVSPMKTRAGWQLNQRKPSPLPASAAQNTPQIARAADQRQKKVSGQFRIAREVAEDRVGQRHADRAANREAVETVGQVHRVGSAHDDQREKDDREHAHVDHQPASSKRECRGLFAAPG